LIVGILTPSFWLHHDAAAAAKGSLRIHLHLPLSLLFLPLPPSLPQGSQDSTGGQEALVAPPFSTFPPPPPPQNGLPGTEFGPGAMYGAGGQGASEVGAGANGATAAANNNVSTLSSESLRRLSSQLLRYSFAGLILFDLAVVFVPHFSFVCSLYDILYTNSVFVHFF